jgi:hypothetical protein
VALTDRLTLRSEVMYANFPDREYRQFIVPVPAPGVAPFFSNFTHRDSMWISKIGLNYQFTPVSYYRR